MSIISFGASQSASSTIVLVLLAFSINDVTCIWILTVVRIDKQVEGIIVEGELVTVGLRHRAPGLQTTVVMTALIVVTTIVIRTVIIILRLVFTCTIVCLNKIGLEVVTQGGQCYQFLLLFSSQTL